MTGGGIASLKKRSETVGRCFRRDQKINASCGVMSGLAALYLVHQPASQAVKNVREIVIVGRFLCGLPHEASFTDTKGYIGTYPFEVTPKFEPTPIPTTPEPRMVAVTATAHSSNDGPAYFVVTGGSGKAKISTSAGIDWVVEYTDARGAIQKINNKGQIDPEEFTIDSGGETIYLKVYPYRFSDEGEVTIFAEGADRVGVATEVPPAFAATATPTPKAPLPGLLALFAVLALGLMRGFR